MRHPLEKEYVDAEMDEFVALRTVLLEASEFALCFTRDDLDAMNGHQRAQRFKLEVAVEEAKQAERDKHAAMDRWRDATRLPSEKLQP